MKRIHAGVGLIVTIALWCGESGQSYAQTVRPQDCETAQTSEWKSADALLLAEIKQNAEEYSACITGESNGWCTELGEKGRELIRQRSELLNQANRKARACRQKDRAERAENRRQEGTEPGDQKALAETDISWKRQYEAVHGMPDPIYSLQEGPDISETLADRVLNDVSRIHADVEAKFETAMAGVNAQDSAEASAEDTR